MRKHEMDRREFLKVTGAVIGGSMIAGASRFAFAQPQPGAKVDSMKLRTETAATDPIREEMARACSQAFQAIGWDVEVYPAQVDHNVQKVMREHDYDMWLTGFPGIAARIDPDLFIYQCHHSGEYKKGVYNVGGVSDPEIDKLAEAQRAEMNVEKRREIVFKAQELTHEAQFWNIVVNHRMTNAYRSDRIKNLTPMMGEGIGGFWTDLSMEVIQGNPYVRTARRMDVNTWNPVAIPETISLMEVRMIYDSLFRTDSEGKAIPWMAKSYNIPDPKTIDIIIRDGMLWHDGEPVTVEDVKFSFDYQTKWKAPYFFSMLRQVDAVEITGKNSIRIRLKEPFAPFLSNLLGGMFIIPKHIWQDIPEKVGLDDALKYPNDKPIGSGPFKLDYFDRGREYRATAFKQHFSPPKCAGIIGIVYGSHDATAAAIEKGECDRTRHELTPSLFLDLKKVKHVVAKDYPNHGFYTIAYHVRRPPLTDPVFRKALAHVTPKSLIIETCLSGLADPGGSIIAPANKFWHNPAVKPFPTDVKKAKKILADAGYTWDNQNKLHYPKKV